MKRNKIFTTIAALAVGVSMQACASMPDTLIWKNEDTGPKQGKQARAEKSSEITPSGMEAQACIDTPTANAAIVVKILFLFISFRFEYDSQVYLRRRSLVKGFMLGEAPPTAQNKENNHGSFLVLTYN